jgi:hypothetical protein
LSASLLPVVAEQVVKFLVAVALVVWFIRHQRR